LAWAIPFVGAGALALFAHGARAADHTDGPAAIADQSADITDVYAFMSPDPASKTHLVLIMNVAPLASATTAFSNKVTYKFHIKPITGTAPITVGADANVTCTFAGTAVTCNGPNSLSATGTVGTVGGSATDPMRVFAGPRSDPFYFDLDAFKATITSGTPKFTSPGTNHFASLNVLSIVVEIDAAKAFGANDAGAANAILAVAAETTRSP
jgi:hypothetical protein